MDEKKATNEDAQTKDLATANNGEDADELLQKISEVVNDEESPSKPTLDVSKSSEKDFLKKIEEIENENIEKSSSKDGAATSSDIVVIVGEIVRDNNAKIENKNDKEDNTNLVVLTNTTLIEKDKEKPVNIVSPVKSNIKKAIEINFNEQFKEIENNKIKSLPNKTDHTLAESQDFRNSIKIKEIVPIHQNDKDEITSEVLPRKDIHMEKLKNISKSEITDTNISNTQNDMLVKDSFINVSNNEEKIKCALEIQSSTDSIQDIDNESNDKIKRKELPESNEALATVKNIIQCSNPSIKKDSLKDNSSNDNVANNEGKCTNKIVQANNSTKTLDFNLGHNNSPSNIINENLQTNLNCALVSTPTVFNSTPISKKFEISSENVSKISEVETSQNMDEPYELPKVEDTATDIETDCRTTCTSSESDHKISDGINKYVEICKNGIPGTTTDDEYENSARYATKSETIPKVDMLPCSQVVLKPNLETKSECSYEVNFLPNENDIRYFSVEKLDLKHTNSNILVEKTTSISSDQSSYGSISSLTPFTLPTKSISHLSEISSTTSTSASQKTFNPLIQSPKNMTHVFKNKIHLCDFVIQHFEKIKNNEVATAKNLNESSVAGNKRSLNIVEDDAKFKQSKRDASVKKNDEDSDYGECVLAKWVDKKYYAGRISGEKPGNKFVVLFEDGASKILSKDAIVFGQDRVLPLKDQSVYALVGEENYERGMVISIEKTDDKTYYTVQTDNKTVKITSSDIYLQESQAKIIQKSEIKNKLTTGQTSGEHQIDIGVNSGRSTRNKRSLTSPATPEAGFSGSAQKGNKRQKRSFC